ncbi:hypothetical protein [Streptomyces blattellae]|uniref:hypothetical protein n=1 Tax=Streptomyces blattellae TaxID=2569855 RepID=UPI0012B9B880|nr:hypothetical protein [Streptomyces blattellae]
MRERTARVIESLLLVLVRVLLPARGRHRAAPTQRPSSVRSLAAPSGHHPLDLWPFEPDTHLVRPYLLTPDERRARKGLEAAA